MGKDWLSHLVLANPMAFISVEAAAAAADIICNTMSRS